MLRVAMAACLMAWAGAVGAAAALKPPAAPKAAPGPKSPAAPKAAPGPKFPGLERLTCRTGPNDEQARLIAQVVKGRTMEFAYYSRLGTRVCSIHGRRGDAYSKWADDSPGKATVKLLSGTALLEYKPGYLKITLDDVDRMTYCGMHGEINASIEVMKGKAECTISGVFDLGSGAIPDPKPVELKEPVKEEAKPDAPAQEAPKQETPKPEEPKA